jgi:hypothetical protein
VKQHFRRGFVPTAQTSQHWHYLDRVTISEKNLQSSETHVREEYRLFNRIGLINISAPYGYEGAIAISNVFQKINPSIISQDRRSIIYMLFKTIKEKTAEKLHSSIGPRFFMG